ncbi:MAG TPA: dihydrodipicolinate reductase C-terminal domain-containing protein [Pyrinomonadaceae bacterium]|jgi:4-hydroxy-tetrahydrodipicolinate reductase
MRLALLGHGTMGRLVEARARADGHEVSVADSRAAATDLAAQLRGADAAIDFSVAAAVAAHVAACVEAQVPCVVGTTGWREQEAEVRRAVEAGGGALVYGANFSVGANLFYRVVARAAELFAGFDAYAPFIEEAHHARKRDAPSGTALKLRDLLAASYKADVPVSTTRAGHIPGTHRVGFDAVEDQIILTHAARSREGFAAGALVAARWLTGRRGVYEFGQVIDEMLKERLEQR